MKEGLLDRRERELRDFFYEKNSSAFNKAFNDGIKSICSNTVELAVILLVANGCIKAWFIIPVIIYNFYTGIMALRNLRIVEKTVIGITRNRGKIDMFSGLLLDISSSIVAGRSSRLMMATIYMHIILIVLISIYYHIIPGIILAILFYFMQVQFERIYLRIMEYYKA